MSSTTSLEPAGIPPGPPRELPPQAGRAAAGIAIVLVAQLMIVLDATVVNVALPRIDADLAFGPASLSWVLNAYTLAFGGLLLLGGRLGDVFGRRRAFQVGLAVFTVASALGGFAQTPGQLVAHPRPPGRRRRARRTERARPAHHERARRGRPQPRLRALRRRLLRWRLHRPDPRRPAHRRRLVALDALHQRARSASSCCCSSAASSTRPRVAPDASTSSARASATVGAVSLVWALIGAPEHGWGSARTIGGFVLGAALLLLLARTETRHPHPMVQPHLVRNRRRVGALAAMALVIGANLSMFFLVVQYVQTVLGFGPLMSGFAFLPFSLGIFGMSRLTPWLIGRVGPRAMLMTGTAALTVGYAWLSGGGTDGTYLGTVFGPMLIAGLATGLVFMPITVTVLAGRRARARRFGVRPAADHAAARQRGRCRGHRLGVRRRRGAGPVRARPAGGLPHLGRLRGPGAAGRDGDRAPYAARRGRAERGRRPRAGAASPRRPEPSERSRGRPRASGVGSPPAAGRRLVDARTPDAALSLRSPSSGSVPVSAPSGSPSTGRVSSVSSRSSSLRESLPAPSSAPLVRPRARPCGRRARRASPRGPRAWPRCTASFSRAARAAVLVRGRPLQPRGRHPGRAAAAARHAARHRCRRGRPSPRRPSRRSVACPRPAASPRRRDGRAARPPRPRDERRQPGGREPGQVGHRHRDRRPPAAARRHRPGPRPAPRWTGGATVPTPDSSTPGPPNPPKLPPVERQQLGAHHDELGAGGPQPGALLVERQREPAADLVGLGLAAGRPCRGPRRSDGLKTR